MKNGYILRARCRPQQGPCMHCAITIKDLHSKLHPTEHPKTSLISAQHLPTTSMYPKVHYVNGKTKHNIASKYNSVRSPDRCLTFIYLLLYLILQSWFMCVQIGTCSYKSEFVWVYSCICCLLDTCPRYY